MHEITNIGLITIGKEFCLQLYFKPSKEVTDGFYDLDIPQGAEYVSSTLSSGSYDSVNHKWNIPFADSTETASICFKVTEEFSSYKFETTAGSSCSSCGKTSKCYEFKGITCNEINQCVGDHAQAVTAVDINLVDTLEEDYVHVVFYGADQLATAPSFNLNTVVDGVVSNAVSQPHTIPVGAVGYAYKVGDEYYLVYQNDLGSIYSNDGTITSTRTVSFDPSVAELTFDNVAAGQVRFTGNITVDGVLTSTQFIVSAPVADISGVNGSVYVTDGSLSGLPAGELVYKDSAGVYHQLENTGHAKANLSSPIDLVTSLADNDDQVPILVTGQNQNISAPSADLNTVIDGTQTNAVAQPHVMPVGSIGFAYRDSGDYFLVYVNTAGNNIYNSDGILSANRALTLSTRNLSINGTGAENVTINDIFLFSVNALGVGSDFSSVLVQSGDASFQSEVSGNGVNRLGLIDNNVTIDLDPTGTIILNAQPGSNGQSILSAGGNANPTWEDVIEVIDEPVSFDFSAAPSRDNYTITVKHNVTKLNLPTDSSNLLFPSNFSYSLTYIGARSDLNEGIRIITAYDPSNLTQTYLWYQSRAVSVWGIPQRVNPDPESIFPEQSSTFTASPGNRYLVNTTSAPVTVIVGPGAAKGTKIWIHDSRENASVNNIIVDFNTYAYRLHGVPTPGPQIISQDRGFKSYVYVDNTIGWIEI